MRLNLPLPFDDLRVFPVSSALCLCLLGFSLKEYPTPPAVAEKPPKLIETIPLGKKCSLHIRSTKYHVKWYIGKTGKSGFGTAYEAFLHDSQADREYRVWSIIFPKPEKQKYLHHFTVGIRDANRIGLAYAFGPNAHGFGFYEVNIAKESPLASSEIPYFQRQPHPRPKGYSYSMGWFGTYSHHQPAHRVGLIDLYEKVYGDRFEERVQKYRTKPKSVEWIKDRWQVTVEHGKRQFVFTQSKNRENWKLRIVQP